MVCCFTSQRCFKDALPTPQSIAELECLMVSIPLANSWIPHSGIVWMESVLWAFLLTDFLNLLRGFTISRIG